ncbi:MAG TPA: MarR family winged helix-turn-helix transcriptional regulator [Gemmatimonadaceae bacterium]|jgi:DNA-binding MarR family transcriptional regulator|nr:MarR family winged helix-turn-helix transcriptional regulator [Gemmatimonadaceae bacterium]
MAPTSRPRARRQRRKSPASSPRPAVAQSVDAIRRILRALRLAARETQVAAGLSAAQLFVLHALSDGDEASLSDLAARTLTDRSSVAAVVDRLLDAKLVVRGTAAADRRRAAITLTAAGRAVLARAPEPPGALLISALQALPERRVAALADGLTALVGAMGVSGDAAGMLFEDGESSAPRKRAARSARRG